MTLPLKQADGTLSEFIGGTDRLPVTVLPMTAALPTFDSSGNLVFVDRTAVLASEVGVLEAENIELAGLIVRSGERRPLVDRRGNVGVRGTQR